MDQMQSVIVALTGMESVDAITRSIRRLTKDDRAELKHRYTYGPCVGWSDNLLIACGNVFGD